MIADCWTDSLAYTVGPKSGHGITRETIIIDIKFNDLRFGNALYLKVLDQFVLQFCHLHRRAEPTVNRSRAMQAESKGRKSALMVFLECQLMLYDTHECA